MKNLKDILYSELEKIKNDKDYQSLTSFPDTSLFESYWLLGELLDPNNAYEYTEKIKGYWIFTDDQGYDFFVRIYYEPQGNYFVVKMGWVDLEKGNKYLRQPARSIDEKRSDTVAKIFRDGVLPLFLKQSLSNELKSFPLDIKRYQFTIRLFKKYISNKKIDLIEDKPNSITLVRKD